MKQKIFQKLKTSYSQLGLGDEILMEHADALAKLGFVTDDNLDAVVSVQGDYLAKLQKLNDKRVNDAVAKTKKEVEDEAAKKKAEDEAKAKAAAEEAAKKKAEEEAAAKKAAEEAAKAKAAEEEAKKKAEEMRKNAEIPDYFKKYMEEQAEANKKREEEYTKRIQEMQEASKKAAEEQTKLFEELRTNNSNLQKNYDEMKKKADEADKAAAARKREKFIADKAKELNIPQYRIDEGFAFASDATDEQITAHLTTVANNIKVNHLPGKSAPYPHTDASATKEELDAVAGSLIH